MLKRNLISATIVLLFFVITGGSLLGQGLPRSTGIGIRGGMWVGQGGTSSTGTSLGDLSVAVETNIGGSGYIYFFSRLTGNWFLEASFGGIGTASSIENSLTGNKIEGNAVVPALLGCRFDFLPAQVGRTMHPYLSLGGGSYWIIDSTIETGLSTRVAAESDFEIGVYTGVGMHITLASWFALNFDTKYHFVGFDPGGAYSGFEFGMGFAFMWGRKRQIFRIEEIKVIVEDIYPAYHSFYNTYPIALVAIKNTVDYPIEVNIKSEIQGYSERPQESGFIRIEGGEQKDIPVRALFGSKLLSASQREPAVIDLEVEARAGIVHTTQVSAHVMIHNRNAWNGEIDKLGFFVTPDAEEILAFHRTLTASDTVSTEMGGRLRNINVARAVLQRLRQLDIRYQTDPNILFYQDDRVQFANETLDIRAGDCDDLVVLLSSLFEGAGIKTAFVDVQNPEKEVAHVYLLMDTGLTPDQGHLVSSNEKRYLIREQRGGKRTIWIPVESTLLGSGFDEAWQSGAMQYLQEGVIQNGLTQGWVKIIDVN